MNHKRVPPRPRFSQFVARLLDPFNVVFDWIFHSDYNPFYRSGTLAIGLLFVLLATGFYLLFFYSVSTPYESVAALQQQPMLGRWVRALHRYATDATLVAVVFHVLQLFAQGKTWGPRTLAWVSGVILLIALLVSAWTGYVMVWDQHGQLLALAGGKLLQTFPFLRDEISRAFSGHEPVPASFFFMNLFLHIAIPLGMVFAMGIHTARLARTVWFPTRSVFWPTLAALTLLSVLMPAVLMPKADLLQMLGEINIDWFYLGWIPLIDTLTPAGLLALWAIGIIFLISVPWWCRPPESEQPAISQVDPVACGGCTQCVRDCPYDAIKMVPHPNGKRLLAEIASSNCVSCGICVASCDDLAIGPPGRNSNDQLARADELCEQDSIEQGIVIVGCWHNDDVPQFLQNEASTHNDLHYFGLHCCGTLHTNTLEKFLEHCGGVLLVGCAARNCMNRDGLDLLIGRVYQKRVPFLKRDIDRNRIELCSNSKTEEWQVQERLAALRSYIATERKPDVSRNRLSWYSKRTVAACILVGGIGVLSQVPVGESNASSQLRVMSRLKSQTALACRALSEQEKANIPQHMQRKEICQRMPISYTMEVSVDGNKILRKEIKPKGLRSELPIYVMEDIAIEPGQHRVAVEVEASDSHITTQHQQIDIDLSKGEIFLISLDESTRG